MRKMVLACRGAMGTRGMGILVRERVWRSECGGQGWRRICRGCREGWGSVYWSVLSGEGAGSHRAGRCLWEDFRRGLEIKITIWKVDTADAKWELCTSPVRLEWTCLCCFLGVYSTFIRYSPWQAKYYLYRLVRLIWYAPANEEIVCQQIYVFFTLQYVLHRRSPLTWFLFQVSWVTSHKRFICQYYEQALDNKHGDTTLEQLSYNFRFMHFQIL